MPPAGNKIGAAPTRNGRGRQFQGFGEGGSPATAVHDLVGGHHDEGVYGNRKSFARGITQSVIDPTAAFAHLPVVLTKSELLSKVEGAAKSRADIARVLQLAPARITEMFKGDRDLSFNEARTLITHYNIEGESGSPDWEAVEREFGIAMVEEVDLALGMGGGTFDGFAESKGMVPFKQDWLRGLHSGPVANLRVVRGEGDSMQPTILDGDLVLVDTSQSNILSQDRIWAVFWGELGMIKRVRRTPGGGFLLMSDNAAVGAIEAVDGEMSVLGRVIWIGRRM